MVILGLTGSIGMGKSTAAGAFRRMGVPVHDADAAVHRLLAKGGAAVPEVGRLFPQALCDDAIDRQRLASLVFGRPKELARLEAVLHPLVRQAALDFLRAQARRRCPLVVLDIPLLFETGGETLCDAVVVVSAPARVQRSRVLGRPGMTPERFDSILAKQMPDREKRRRADFVVQTGLGKRHALNQLATVVRLTTAIPARRWPPSARPGPAPRL